MKTITTENVNEILSLENNEKFIYHDMNYDYICIKIDNLNVALMNADNEFVIANIFRNPGGKMFLGIGWGLDCHIFKTFAEAADYINCQNCTLDFNTITKGI